MLEGCINLLEVHPSIAIHKKLTLLNLKGCRNLNCLPSKIEMESLEILILSGCSKIKRIPEFMGNIERLQILHLDGTSITDVPSSIKHLINLAGLKILNPIGSQKKEKEKQMILYPLRDLKKYRLLEKALSGLWSLTVLNLSDCHLQSIPSMLGCLSSLDSLYLARNYFECLPESIIQLSKLKTIDLNDCMRLRSLPQLPSSTSFVGAADCNSLETLPNRLILDKLRQPPLYLFNCFKLAGNQGWSDMFFRMLSGDTQVSLSLSLSVYIYILLNSKHHYLFMCRESMRNPKYILWRPLVLLFLEVKFRDGLNIKM